MLAGKVPQKNIYSIRDAIDKTTLLLQHPALLLDVKFGAVENILNRSEQLLVIVDQRRSTALDDVAVVTGLVEVLHGIAGTYRRIEREADVNGWLVDHKTFERHRRGDVHDQIAMVQLIDKESYVLSGRHPVVVSRQVCPC